jgi:hypothetical protein
VKYPNVVVPEPASTPKLYWVQDPLGARVILGVIDGVAVILGVAVLVGVIDGVLLILILGVIDGVAVLVGVILGVIEIEIEGVTLGVPEIDIEGVILGVTVVVGVILGVIEIEIEIEGVTLGGTQTVDVATTPDVVIWNALAGVVNGAVAKPYHSRLPFHNESKLVLEYNTSPFTILAISLLSDHIDVATVESVQAGVEEAAPLSCA